MVFVQLTKSDQEGKKYKAIFYDEARKKIKTTHFGATGYSDYTKHKDEERKRLYLERHKKEDWQDYKSAGACSRWILWNKPSVSASYNDYLKKFNLTKY